MVLLKARYLACVLRTISNTKQINLNWKQLSTTAVLQTFTKITNTDKHLEELPKGFDGWEPVDDVYLIKRYPIKARPITECLDELRAQDRWAYCRKPELNSDRTVNLSLLLDLTLEKKKKIDPFQGMVILPHKFKPENKVICFAESEQATEALESGAYMIGDKDLIEKISNNLFTDFNFIVATPSMMPSLMPLKSRLRKRFPNSKRASVGVDVKKMVNLYLHGTQYKVQSKIPHINVSIGKLSLSNSQLEENVKTLIEAVNKHKPHTAGPIIRKATISAFLLDGHPFIFDSYIPVSSNDENLEDQLKTTEDQLFKKI